MAQAQEPAYESSYRQQQVDGTLEDHESRITDNERRWLLTKGALGMLATYEGVDFAVTQIASLI